MMMMVMAMVQRSHFQLMLGQRQECCQIHFPDSGDSFLFFSMLPARIPARSQWPNLPRNERARLSNDFLSSIGRKIQSVPPATI